MLRNYLNIALRSLRAQKGYALINLTGLAVGMACCILLLLYVQHELSYDRFHANSDSIYRIQMDRYSGDEKVFSSAVTFPMVGPTLAQDFPEVTTTARLLPTGSVLQYADQAFRQRDMFYADSTFLTLFSFPFVVGDPVSALTQPNTIVLSEANAIRFFGSAADAMGRTMQLNGQQSLTVSGVYADLPANSHITFDALVSFVTLEARSEGARTSWGWYDFYTYIQLRPDTDPAAFETKLPAFIDRYKGEALANLNRREVLLLQPLTDIHLYSNLSWEANVNGNGQTVYFLLIIAGFILVIAWVNFINLSTARSLDRAREVGVRKTLGAARIQLVRQFMLESFLINLLAALASLALVYLTLPYFVELIGVELSLSVLGGSVILVGLVALFVVGTVLAGLYPAFFLSSFRPVQVLKGGGASLSKGLGFRRGMVVFQFAASIVLIAGTFIVSQQIAFMQAQDLGIDMDQKLVLRGPAVLADRDAYPEQFDVFRQVALQQTAVSSFSAVSSVPGNENFWIGGFRTEQMAETEAQDIYLVGIDYAFVDAFGVKLLAGRAFDEAFGTDNESIILNATAARLLGFDTSEAALEGRIVWGDGTRPIIGVVEDYHVASLKESVDPMMFLLRPNTRSYYTMQVNTADLPATLATLEAEWNRVFPGNPFEYFFLDSFFDQQYRSDRLFGRVFGLFAMLAIAIACLGLFGLAAFSVQRRTKEIGIRKVLGASIPNLLRLLSKEYAMLVLLASVVAWPIAYILMQQWLQGFALHIDVNLTVLLLAGGIALAIALLTVSYNALKAALSDPIQALRYE